MRHARPKTAVRGTSAPLALPTAPVPQAAPAPVPLTVTFLLSLLVTAPPRKGPGSHGR